MALWPDAALLLAAVDKGIPFPTLSQCKTPVAVLPRRLLLRGRSRWTVLRGGHLGKRASGDVQVTDKVKFSQCSVFVSFTWETAIFREELLLHLPLRATADFRSSKESLV